VARGNLSEEPNAQGQKAIKGADNLYVYDTVSKTTAFVVELCSGPGRSGITEDLHCPHNLAEGHGDAELLWGSRQSQSQSTPDGAFLVFSSYGQLLSDDTDTAKDIYRYDTQTGALERVSLGVSDYHANGNSSAFDADIAPGAIGIGVGLVYLQHEMATHAMSADGSQVVFHTTEPLSPDATNGRSNIYEWDEGSVSLISSGSAEEDDIGATITPSGNDIMFRTSQGLVQQDRDGLQDFYDARTDGGFPPPPAERQPCSGDACQGPLTDPVPLLLPGSVSQAPGGNLVARPRKHVVKPKKKKVRKSKKKVRRKERPARMIGKASTASGRNRL
jgi:hypothetical protein